MRISDVIGSKSSKDVITISPDATVRDLRADGVTVRTAGHTARELDAAKARIDKLSAPDGVAGWHVDPKAGTVAVGVVRGPAVAVRLPVPAEAYRLHAHQVAGGHAGMTQAGGRCAAGMVSL